MMELEEAQARILELVQPLPVEREPIASCLGRVLRETVLAPIDLPPFDNSAMDGYAVQAADVVAASSDQPCALEVDGKTAAGQTFRGTVRSGHCVRLFTGSPLPEGADAVVMQEDTTVPDSPLSRVHVLAPVKPWENVRFKGEDVKQGAVAAAAGERLTAGRIAQLAALGCAEVPVGQKPLLGLVATGSELREPGQPLGAGQIYESNRVTLAALAFAAGARPMAYPLVQDDLSESVAALRRAFAECDAVATSGGVSVGEFDLVKAAFEQLGGELTFWRVAIKPGKPFVMGKLGQKLLFGLPGNPVSAFVTFLLLVFPALLRFQGASRWSLPVQHGQLLETLDNPGDRRHFLRVAVDAKGRVSSAGTQASHLLHSLAAASGLVDVPPRTALAPGTMVTVLRWDT